MNAAALSPIIIAGAAVFPDVTLDRREIVSILFFKDFHEKQNIVIVDRSETHPWHDRRIGNAKSSNTVDLQLWIDNRHRIVGGTHFAGTSLVILRTGVLTNSAFPVFGREEWKFRARGYRCRRKVGLELRHRSRVHQRESDLYALDEDVHVTRILKIISPNDWLGHRIVARQTKVS